MKFNKTYIANIKFVHTLLCVLFFAISPSLHSQIELKGQVQRNDSTHYSIDQVLIVNKKNSTGTLSDIKGFYRIKVDSSSVLIVKKMGYLNDTIYVRKYWNEIRNGIIQKNIYLTLSPVVLPTFVLKYKYVSVDPVERRKEWSYVLDRPIASAQSPITALYQQFSKKGKELRKLEALYYEDEKRRYMDQRFSRFKAVILTGLAGDDLDAFLMSCRPSYEIMILYNDYDLYERIKLCYEEYKLLHPEVINKIIKK